MTDPTIPPDRTNDLPRRPRQGLRFEDALKRWSPREAYAEMEALYSPAFGVPILMVDDAPDPAEEKYRRVRRSLERLLFERLADAILVCSATEKRPDPRDPRFIVHPSTFDDTTMSMSRFGNVVIGQNVELWNVEIFEPSAIPRNLTRIPDWLTTSVFARAENDGPRQESKEPEFTAEAGYAHVKIRGIEFVLNPLQAGIVRMLHNASLSGDRWISGEALRAELGFTHAKLSGVFRYKPDWRELIASDGRGNYRLKIDD